MKKNKSFALIGLARYMNPYITDEEIAYITKSL